MFSSKNSAQLSRKAWYLPISPSPKHPFAKAKAQYKTLQLAGGSPLRYDSYVKIRDLYKINGLLLWPYINPDAPQIKVFQLDAGSVEGMNAATKDLIGFDAGGGQPVASSSG